MIRYSIDCPNTRFNNQILSFGIGSYTSLHDICFFYDKKTNMMGRAILEFKNEPEVDELLN